MPDVDDVGYDDALLLGVYLVHLSAAANRHRHAGPSGQFASTPTDLPRPRDDRTRRVSRARRPPGSTDHLVEARKRRPLPRRLGV